MFHKAMDVHRGLSSILGKLGRHVKEGADVADIDSLFYEGCQKRGLYPSVLGYDGFPRASCISVNEEVCHCVPYPRKLKDGNIVTIDVCAYDGYHSDMADTYCIGKVSGEHKKLVDVTRDALYNAIKACKPGVPYNEIGRIVSKTVSENGFVLIDKFGGHGIGKEVHMKPRVSNHINKEKTLMKEGDTFAIEPLVTIGSGRLREHMDGFGYSTLNGKYAAHFKRTVLITGSAHEVLNEL